MRFKMIENAIDSLQITIDFFNKWTRCSVDKGERYLKLSIIFLYNSMELLLKALLIKKDDTCIYSKISEKELCEARKEYAHFSERRMRTVL